MAVTFSITRTTTRFHDSNGNGVKDSGELDFDFGEVGVYDPGDILYTRISITNTGDQTATGVTISDTFSGSSFVDASNALSATPFINISPIAFNDSFQAIGNTVLRVGTAGTMNGGESITFAGNLISNDVGNLGADSITGFQIDVVGDGTFAGSGVTAKGGHYNILADGSFNYVNSGSDTSLTDGDSFTYTIRDKGFDGIYNTADDLTSTATVTITFAEQSPGVAHRVWYVDSAAAPGGDGTSANPFQTLAPINGAANNGAVTGDLDQAGEYIYVENGAGAAVAGPITLENGQRLIGDGADLIVAGSTLASATTNSTITAASGSIVTLGSGNTIAGLNLGNGTGTAAAITGTSFGTLTVNNTAINAGGQALNLNTGTFAGTGFTSTDSDGGASNVSLQNVTGSVALGSGALSGATASAISIVNSTGAAVSTGLTYSGSVTHAGTGALLNVDGGTAGHLGTISLTGTKSATAGTGLNFENADGDYTVTGTTTLNGGNAGIDIVSNTAGNAAQGSAGSFTFGGTFTINNPGGSAVTVSDSTATINFDVDVTQSSNHAALAVTNHSTGTFTFQTTASFNMTNGTGFQFDGADGTYTLNSANTFNGGDAGVDIINDSDGSFSFLANTSITNPTGTAFNVNGGNGNITYNGTITDDVGQIVSIQNRDGGTIDFNGLITDGEDGDGGISSTDGSIDLASNTGATIRFDGGLRLSTGANDAFQATGGGTVVVTDSDGAGAAAFNRIATTSGGALEVSNTFIGANGLTFLSISSNGAPNGILLNNTGTTSGTHGGLTVTGDTGSAKNATGGTIANSTGAGISITGARDINLDQMTVSGNGTATTAGGPGEGDGVYGNGVVNFSLTNSTITNNGNELQEHGIEFINLSGTGNFTNLTLTNNETSQIKIINTSGTANIALTNSTLSSTGVAAVPNGAHGLHVETQGTAAADVSVTGTAFDNLFSNSIHATNASTGVFEITIATSTFNNVGASAINIAQSNSGTTRFYIHDNGTAANPTFLRGTNNGVSHSINVNQAGGTPNTAILEGAISNNHIGSASSNQSATTSGDGIRVLSVGSGTTTVRIDNNVIKGVTGNGINVQMSEDADPAHTMNATIFNNNVLATHPNSFDGIRVVAGATSGDVGTFRADIHDNVASATAGNDFTVRARFGTTMQLLNYAGGTSEANLQNYLDNTRNNTATNNTWFLTPQGAGTYGNTASVPQPTLPSPMMAVAPPEAPVVDYSVDDRPAPTPPVGDGTPAPAPDPAPAPAGPVVVDDGVLSQAELDLIVEAAIQRWIDAGATEAQVAAMRAVDVKVSDLAGLTLGKSDAGTITLDSDAAGWRWFVDSTPGDDSEYAGSGTKLSAVDSNGMAGTRIDLLTVVTHELGHQIGLADIYAPGESDELMFGSIGAGQRRLPGSDDLDHASGAPVTGAFAFAPISLGTIPAGQKVIVEFRHVINAPAEDGLVGPWTGKTIIDSDQTDPQDSNTETGAVDSLTLGDRVFIDSNEDGNYDAGEGVAGVSVSLYADTNNSGGWDSGDAQVGVSQLTGAGGLYSFAGLAPGDYIVVVNGSSFDSGQPLNGKVSIAGEADPNNNVDNDDNGVAGIAGLGAGIASQAIRLDYGLEPTDDGDSDSDTNLTLDFGFFAPNQAPVIGALNGDSATYYENGAAIPIDVGQNATVTDSDSANFDGGSLTLQVTGSTGDRIVWGPAATFDGDNKVYVGATHIGQLSTAGNQIIVTLNANATPANIQTLIRNFLFDVNSETPVAGTRTFTFTLVDGDGNDGGLGNDTGTASTTIEVVPVSDAPVGADRTGTGLFDSTGATYAFTVADFATGFTDPDDDPANSFSGVKITTLPSASAGTIYYDSNLADATPAVAIAAGDTFTAQDLTDGKLTFVGAAGSGGMAMSFTFQVLDNGSTANGGVVMDATPNTFSTTIIAGNSAPVVDLDADDSNTVGTGFTSSYVEGGAAAISDTDVTITDVDSGDDIVSATITITNAVAGDKLSVGTLPTGVTVDPSSTDTVLKLVAAAGTSATDFEAAIEAVQFENTGNDPTAGGNTSRTITVTVNDGTSESTAATATISVTGTNDSPDGTDATITATEDTFRILSAGDFGFSDPDSADSMSAVTITAVNGSGQLYYDADGTAGAGAPVAVTTFPQTYTVSELAAGNVSYRAPADANGNALATIDFQVVDSGAAGNSTDPVGNILTVNVTAVNDAPVLTTDSPIAAIEQTAVAILPAGSVVDVELDARNGGNGDYAGAQFSVNRNSAVSTDDIFTLVDGANFTVDGINLKTTGGQIFGQISANNPGLIVISFNSSQAIATSALVDEVIQSVRYTNISDNPPASVDLAVGLTDGSTGGGQGTVIPGQTLDVNVVTVDIEAVNDAPVNSLGGTIGTGEDAVDAWLSGMSITDPDIDPATEAMLVKFEVANGTLEIRTDVVGGIVAGDVTYPDVGVISVLATLDKINATLAATNGLTYTPNANFNGDDTLTVTTNDRGWDGTDPGLSGDHISEEDIDTRTITVSAVDDAAVAQDDDVSTLENAVKTGDLFANNGSGADFDVEDDPFSITKVTVNGTDYAPGTEIDLPSGAKLTVNADGTYSYNPNGKFTRLTDGSSGAVNTSAEDIFSYTVTGGDTATVTMTVNGVAGPGDWLMGDSGDNTIVGTPEPDFFFVSQGGDDDVSGLGSNDGFYFGAALTVDDVVDGGAGLDELAIQGDYTGANALTLGDVTDVEVLVILPGNDARFGDAAGNSYSYDITTANENVAAGGILYVDAARLRSTENLTFDGSAEADGRFYVYGGRGTDTITGGGQADLFLFRGTGKFTAADTIDGGGGLDELALRGDYTGANKVVFGTDTISDIEAIVVISGHDLRYGLDIGDVSYDLKVDNGNLSAGQLLIVDGGTLRAGESLSFDGSAETDGGQFKIFGGKGDDVLRGGTGNDVIRGGLGQDTQTGGGGDDRFVFSSAADSTLAVAEGIGDFSVGDLLDLSAIDAKTGVPGNDTFTFIGTDGFNNQAGEVRAVQYSGPIWQVQADIDGDGAADLNFFVTTDHDLVITDFVL